MNWTKNKYAVLAVPVAAALCALMAGTGYSQTGAASATGSGTRRQRPNDGGRGAQSGYRIAQDHAKKHGEIKNLDMPAMTMTFNVRDAALIDKLAAGDRIRFMPRRQRQLLGDRR